MLKQGIKSRVINLVHNGHVINIKLYSQKKIMPMVINLVHNLCTKLIHVKWIMLIHIHLVLGRFELS